MKKVIRLTETKLYEIVQNLIETEILQGQNIVDVLNKQGFKNTNQNKINFSYVISKKHPKDTNRVSISCHVYQIKPNGNVNIQIIISDYVADVLEKYKQNPNNPNNPIRMIEKISGKNFKLDEKNNNYFMIIEVPERTAIEIVKLVALIKSK